jgi:outer membrane protein TolC
MSPERIDPGVAASPSVPWIPPGRAGAPEAPGAAAAEAAPAAGIPADLLESAGRWTLADLVRIALDLSPETRAAWSAARAAAAELGSRRGAYWPNVYADASLNAVRGSAAGGRFTFETTNENVQATLGWLLLDFGGRRASVDGSLHALAAANWRHNEAIQRVVLQVEQAYYRYVGARAFAQAEEAAVEEARASLDAAERRRAAGLATIGDVLQARTRLSQARLALQTARGQVQIVRGVLATAAGLPANTEFDVEPPPDDLRLDQFTAEVERGIEEAKRRRPDLAAAGALVEEARARHREIRSRGLPTLGTTLTGGSVWYNGSSNDQSTYNAALLLRVPIFNGLAQSYNEMKALEEIAQAEASRDAIEQRAIFQVWSSYYSVQTARQNVETSEDLVAASAQSYEFASARYRAGAGSILDLLAAAGALEDARARRVQARSDWLISLAQFAHDTGRLWPPGEARAGGAP